jgi:hypothetical protein
LGFDGLNEAEARESALWRNSEIWKYVGLRSVLEVVIRNSPCRGGLKVQSKILRNSEFEFFDHRGIDYAPDLPINLPTARQVLFVQQSNMFSKGTFLVSETL